MSKPQERRKQKPWWAPVIASSGAFVLASLAYVAAGFGDRNVPVNRFLNQHGGTVIIALAGLTIGCGVLAMYLDQRDQRSADARPPAGPDDGGDP